jgi:tetratricopeptide (TPR) repeat protein
MLKKIILLVLSLLLMTLPILAQDAEATETPEPPFYCPNFTDASTVERTSYYMGEGAAFLRSGNYDAAINAYGCVVQQIDPNYRDAYLNRAAAYTARREYEEALEDYNEAISQDGSFAPAYNNRAIVYTAMLEYERAANDFDRALELDSNYSHAYINRGILKAIQGDWDGAEADFQQAIDVAGLEAIVAELRDPERDPEEAIPAYDIDAARAYAMLGTVHSARALADYNDYILLTGGRADERIRSAAGALESRFQFELRFDDGSWMLLASFVES